MRTMILLGLAVLGLSACQPVDDLTGPNAPGITWAWDDCIVKARWTDERFYSTDRCFQIDYHGQQATQHKVPQDEYDKFYVGDHVIALTLNGQIVGLSPDK